MDFIEIVVIALDLRLQPVFTSASRKMETETVTVEKTYFETLLRRAQFHTVEDLMSQRHLETVNIQKTEHSRLLDIERQFANLQRNLFRGGVVQEQLALLTQEYHATNGTELTTTSVKPDNTENRAPLPATGRQAFTYGRNANNTGNDHATTRKHIDWPEEMNENFSFFTQDVPEDFFFNGENGANDNQAFKSSRSQFEKFAKRSILIQNLPEKTTIADITNVVRGGLVLDIYLRAHDRAASVSFLESVSAQGFFRHVKRHDLYIKGKRVEIRWSERQFILPGHVANKVGIGATRNLVVRNRSPKITEASIRDDLEHIHNLVVVKVTFDDQNVYISTNSVHNSMFARTCMMSRALYKGHKVDWAEDECAGPLVKRDAPLKPAPKTVKVAPLMNRFQPLIMDESEQEEDADTSGITLQSFALSTAEV
ncbi:hypothetical protein BJ878DRAFT_496388 [Calycina marina]|uniref:RRM domain-containing protein n=1 Tax=Calycina marina TaxID=1763456 RepID=A0A9P7Z744_9HELO|nr:hypothetical protein BJ878DRAFT_496388 [Calycina marina]